MTLSNDRVTLRNKSADETEAIVIRQQAHGTLELSMLVAPATSSLEPTMITMANPSLTEAERLLRTIARFEV
jgi:hypothetical protein